VRALFARKPVDVGLAAVVIAAALTFTTAVMEVIAPCWDKNLVTCGKPSVAVVVSV
jgi:hypothetical protein